MVEIHQLAAAIYLAAGIGALVGVVLPSERMSRGAVWGLAGGAVVQTVAFATVHRNVEAVSITSLSLVIAIVSWMSVIFLLLLMWRIRLPALVAAVGPVAFASLFLASLGMRLSETTTSESGAGTWPHVHVLLASAGLALLGIAGLAGLFFLVEHKRLKSKKRVARGARLPSLEALDRVNVTTTVVGFALLTLGLVTGMFWLHEIEGQPWMGTAHEAWMLICWAIYGGLVLSRFAGRHAGRQAAASALAGFAILVFGVLGVGFLG